MRLQNRVIGELTHCGTFRTFSAAAPKFACGTSQHIHILGNSCGRIKEALEPFPSNGRHHPVNIG